MKLNMIFRFTLLILMFSQASSAQDIEINPEVEACVKKNAPKFSTIERVRLTSESLFNEEDDALSAKIYWKQDSDGLSNMLAIFDEPDDILGSRLLFLEKKKENEIYLYMPALFKVRRITTDKISSSMYGMDFSYEDLQWMYNNLSTAIAEQKPDAILNGKSMYVFAIVPQKVSGSMYETIYSYFDKDTCVLRKVEFYEQGKKLRKVLLSDVDQIKKVDDILIPHKFVMHDVKADSETVLKINSISIDQPVSKSLFDPAQLKEHRGIN